MQRMMLAIAGLVLVIMAVAGIRHGVRAEAAQLLYFQARYGARQGQADAILEAAERAHRLYPHNYYLSILAAEAAYYQRFDPVADRERPERWAQAARWCAIGLAQNFYRSQLRLLDTRLTARRSLPEAVAKWEAFVAWQYWEPYNHVVLAELYGRAGRYREALAELDVVRGRQYEGLARRRVAQVWKDEIAQLQALQDEALRRRRAGAQP